jgi:hypothetical protein
VSLNLPRRHTRFEGCLQDQPRRISHNGSWGPHWCGKRFPFDISHVRLLVATESRSLGLPQPDLPVSSG